MSGKKRMEQHKRGELKGENIPEKIINALRANGYSAHKIAGGVNVVKGVKRAKIHVDDGAAGSKSGAIKISPRLSRLNVVVSLAVWFVLVLLVLSVSGFSDSQSMLFVAVLSLLILPFPYYAWRASFDLASDVNSCLEPVFKAYEAESVMRTAPKKRY